MNYSNPWDVSASGPPIASGQVPFYNPAQFQQEHSTGSAVAPSNAFGDAAAHAAGVDGTAASYPYGQEWHSSWNNYGAWPHAQGYNSAGYSGNYFLQPQHPGEPAAPLLEGGIVGAYHGEMAYDTNWSTDQPYEQYPLQYDGGYNYDPTMAGGLSNLAAGTVDTSGVNSSQGAMQLFASRSSEDTGGMSPFFHPRDEASSSVLPPQMALSNLAAGRVDTSGVNSSQGAMQPFSSRSSEDAGGMSPFFHTGDEASSTVLPPQMAPMAPLNVMMEGAVTFASDPLPTVSSFNNLSYQPSPFDELGAMKSPEQPVLPSLHSRQSSAGGNVQFLIGGSSSVSESPSRTDSPHVPGMEVAAGGHEREQDDVESRTAVTEHSGVTQPHFTDAGSHNLSARKNDSPIRSLPPQGTMTGTPASGHHRKLATGSGTLGREAGTPLEQSYAPPDFTAPVSSEASVTQAFSGSTAAEFVHSDASISDEFGIPEQHSQSVAVSEMSGKAEDIGTVYAGPLGSHPGSSFTPVGHPFAVNAAMSPGQQSASGRSAAVPDLPTGSVCSAAGSDTGALDMREIELDAMVDSGSPKDAVRCAEAGSNVEPVSEHRVGSGTFKHNVHDASNRSHLHHYAKAHREATMSPATTLWENPEPTGVRLLPAPVAPAESRSTTDRPSTYELPQNTDAGPSKSGASGIVHEPSLVMHSAMFSADDQRVPHTPVTNSLQMRTSHASSIDNSVQRQIASESSSHTVEHQPQPVIQPVVGPATSNVAQNESVDLSKEVAKLNLSSLSHHSDTSNRVPPKLHVAVPETSAKLTNEDAVQISSGTVVASKDVIQSVQLPEQKPSVDSEVQHTRGMVAHQTSNMNEPTVKHAAYQHYDNNKNSQKSGYEMQNKNTVVHKGAPHIDKNESGSTEAASQLLYDQQKAHQDYDSNMHVTTSKQQHVPNSTFVAPDERRAPRHREEVDRPRSRQDDMDEVNRRPSSRQGYDDRAYDRPRSRQYYDERGYDRPHSRPGYDHGYEHPRSRQVFEDPYGRPRSRQEYEDPRYYRPRSRQGYDDRDHQKPVYEGRHDRPSSRQSYHDPVDRPRSEQEYDRRPRSRQDYEDRYARGSRDHVATGTHYPSSRSRDPDSFNRPSSRPEFSDESSRPRYNAADEGYDRMSRRSYQDDPDDSRYRSSQSYWEEESRQRSQGGELFFAQYSTLTHLPSKPDQVNQLFNR